jgi:hypothetical protein
MFLGTLLLSIAIEGVILTLFFRGKFSLTTIWLTAVGINIISYFGFFLLGVSLIQLEWSVPIMIAVASIRLV